MILFHVSLILLPRSPSRPLPLAFFFFLLCKPLVVASCLLVGGTGCHFILPWGVGCGDIGGAGSDVGGGVALSCLRR